MPDVQSLTGVTVTVPVNTGDVTGSNIFSADMSISYDPAVLAPLANSTFGVTPGPVANSNGSNLLVSNPTPGTLIISLFGTSPMSGSGVLINLNFNVIGVPGTASALNFTLFNYAPACAVTTNGSVTVISGTISGVVSYNNIQGPPVPRYVPNVTLNAAGSPSVSTTTDSSGAYTMSGFGAGSYTVTASKTGGVNGAVTAFDASMIQQYAINQITFTPQQAIVANVSGTDGVTSFDATLVARYAVLLPPPPGFSDTTGNWLFYPASRTYPNVYTNASGEDYFALLMGDVSANWNDPNPLPGGRFASGPVRSIAVQAPQMTVKPNREVMIPIGVQGVVNKGVVAYEFELDYDPTVIQPQANPVSLTGTASRYLSSVVNAQTPGSIRVAVFGTAPINENGVLLNLKFTAVGAPGSVSPLKWESLMLNEGTPRAMLVDGQIEIYTVASNTAEIGGRLLSAYGAGIANTRVTLTDTHGQSLSVLSDGFGIYRFVGLQVAETYTISASTRRWRFMPMTVSAADQAINVDMIAEQ